MTRLYLTTPGEPWDIRDVPEFTPGCSGGRRRKLPKVFRKERAKAKKIAKASKKRNR